ncbi:unnamed protein product [Symbiodinium sp. CCMP2592]|nr:unnamed protein product [Symbiodinium sp. CCMP2592]
MDATTSSLLHPQPGDTKESLTTRYRHLASRLHPDKNPSPAAHSLFIRLTQEYEDAVQNAPSSIPDTEALQRRLMELDAKRQAPMRKKKGWSINKPKNKKQAPRKVLAIEDVKQAVCEPEKAGLQSTSTRIKGDDAPAVVPAGTRNRKEKHAQWEQALLTRKEARKFLERSAREERAAGRQQEKANTQSRTKQRSWRNDFGYEACPCSTEVPKEIRHRFAGNTVEVGAVSESDTDSSEEVCHVAADLLLPDEEDVPDEEVPRSSPPSKATCTGRGFVLTADRPLTDQEDDEDEKASEEPLLATHDAGDWFSWLVSIVATCPCVSR